jgi:hypothetical protein
MKVNFFEEILPQVTTAVEFHRQKRKRKSAMIKAKDIFGKTEPSCHISMKKN